MKYSVEKVISTGKGVIQVRAEGVGLEEMVLIEMRLGKRYGKVIKFDEDLVYIQLFGSAAGISTQDRVTFLRKELQLCFGDDLLGQVLSPVGKPRNEKISISGKGVSIAIETYNPTLRPMPVGVIETGFPAVDVFNTILKGQKIPIFASAGTPYNDVVRKLVNQIKADVVVVGGMGLTYDEYLKYLENAETSGRMDKTVFFAHLASDEPVEAILVPNMALTTAVQFAEKGKDVVVVLSDMTVFADSLKELKVQLGALPANRGYSGSLYSDLALCYEVAVDIAGGGSITIIAVVVMPGQDVTHPVPDTTGYITEGQLFIDNTMIVLEGSLSRLKQNASSQQREDHSAIMNVCARYYSEARMAEERMKMGFRISPFDEALLSFKTGFEKEILSLDVSMSTNKALDTCWQLLSRFFDPEIVPIKDELKAKYWKA